MFVCNDIIATFSDLSNVNDDTFMNGRIWKEARAEKNIRILTYLLRGRYDVRAVDELMEITFHKNWPHSPCACTVIRFLGEMRDAHSIWLIIHWRNRLFNFRFSASNVAAIYWTSQATHTQKHMNILELVHCTRTAHPIHISIGKIGQTQ